LFSLDSELHQADNAVYEPSFDPIDGDAIGIAALEVRPE
jgi:hypothetical protein